MRLFTAILFSKEVEGALCQTVESLRGQAKKGSFTAKENLHLTVNFIGETKRVDEVKTAMCHVVEKFHAGSFELSIRGVGRFKRREGDIYWVGVEKEDTLWRLQKELAKELKDIGFFDIDDMEYTPHLTLGRRIELKEHFQMREFEAGIQPLKTQVRKLSLMKSERIEGRLVYTEIFYVDLKDAGRM